jgi:two-component system, NarL family, sensor histidine kinase UhpB
MNDMNIINILIVEDDPLFYKLINFMLISDTLSEITVGGILRTESIAETQELKGKGFTPEIILLDLNLTDSAGKETFYLIRDIYPEASVVVVSSLDKQIIIRELLKEGAQDYLIKDELDAKMLRKTIEYSLQRKEHTSELLRLEKKFRNVFDLTPLPMFTAYSENGKIDLVNAAFCDYFALPEKTSAIYNQLVFLNGLNGRVGKEVAFQLNDCSHAETSAETRIKYFDIICNRMVDNPSIYACLIVDRTEQRTFELQKQQLISEVQQLERKKIARELHDGVAQHLTAASLFMDQIKSELTQPSVAENLVELIQISLKDLKSIMYDLVPTELDNGILQGLKNFVHRHQRLENMVINLEIAKDVLESDFNQTDKFNLFRIVQEFVQNSLKHASASEIQIKLYKAASEVKVELRDNGIGFDTNGTQRGIGLNSMANRLNIDNISGELISQPGQGTLLKMTVEQE